MGNSPASEFYMPTLWNTLSVPSQTECLKFRHIKFRCWGTAQKKAYNIQNTVEV